MLIELEFDDKSVANTFLRSVVKAFTRETMMVSWFTVTAAASWSALSSPDRGVRVWTLAGDIALCSWARHFTLKVPLSTQVYKKGTGELNAGDNSAMD